MSHEPYEFDRLGTGDVVCEHVRHCCGAAARKLRAVLAILVQLRTDIGDNTDEDHGDIAAALDEAISIAGPARR